jgi:hypothetical protein
VIEPKTVSDSLAIPMILKESYRFSGSLAKNSVKRFFRAYASLCISLRILSHIPSEPRTDQGYLKQLETSASFLCESVRACAWLRKVFFSVPFGCAAA